MREILREFGNSSVIADVNRCDGCPKDASCPIEKFIEMIRSDSFYGEFGPLADKAGLALKSASFDMNQRIITSTKPGDLSLFRESIYSVRICPDGKGTIEIYTEAAEDSTKEV
jgi:hypothetical protein